MENEEEENIEQRTSNAEYRMEWPRLSRQRGPSSQLWEQTASEIRFGRPALKFRGRNYCTDRSFAQYTGSKPRCRAIAAERDVAVRQSRRSGGRGIAQ